MIKLKDFLSIELIENVINNPKNNLEYLQDNSFFITNMLIIHHGEKTVFSALSNRNTDMLSDMINNNYSVKWGNLLQINELIDDLKKGVVSSNVITETINRTDNLINDEQRVNKVSAYNSDELIINDGDTTNKNEVNTGETIRTLTNEKLDYQQIYNTLSTTDKNNIMNTVITDIANFLTLSIY